MPPLCPDPRDRTDARGEVNAGQGRIGYVIKMYPRFSETFIVREILAREAAGEEMFIASLRPPRDPRFHEMVGKVSAPITWIAHERRGSGLWPGLARLRGLGIRLDDELMGTLLDEEAEVAAQALAVAAWAIEARLTHLHAHFLTAAGRTARLAAAITGLPWTVTAHAKDIFHVEYEERRRAQVVSDADAVVAVSDSTADHLRATYPRAVVRRIYNGVEAEALEATGDAARTAEPVLAGLSDGPVVSAVGRLVEKKGWSHLVDAVAELRRRGIAAHLVLVGAGPLAEDLAAQVAGLELDDAVTMCGPLPQEQVLRVIAQSTVFATPCVITAEGDRDGLPTVLLESMALGTPVVSTPVSGVSEAVLHGETGLLAEPEDAISLADRLQTAIEDADLREDLTTAARARIRDLFDSPAQARNLRALSAEMAEARRATHVGAGALG